MSDCMCEDYQKAKENRVRQAADKHEPFYWWEMPDPFGAEVTAVVSKSNGLARTRQELKERLHVQ